MRLVPLYFLEILMIVTSVVLHCNIADELCDHQCVKNQGCYAVEIQNACYYVFLDDKRNWFASEQRCREEGLTMARISRDVLRSDDYNKFTDIPDNVPDRLKELDGKSYAWLGGKAVDFPNFMFVNSTFVSDEHYENQSTEGREYIIL